MTPLEGRIDAVERVRNATANRMGRRQSFNNIGFIGLVVAIGLLNVVYSGYLLLSISESLSWKGLDGFGDQGKTSGGGNGQSQIHSPTITPPPPTPLKIKYVGVAGLGHRMIRMSSIYHLSRTLQVPEIDVMWRGFCPKRYRSKPNIFELLFGNSTMTVPALQNEDLPPLFPFLSHRSPESLTQALFSENSKSKELKIINEVEGYTHMYDNHAIQKVNPPYYGKLMTDFEFYTALVQHYRYKRDVDQLFAPYTQDTTIIGVHIRAGNGEVGDFEKYRQLGQGNLVGWLGNFTNLLKTSVLTDPTLTQSRHKAVIFLATDTASVVDYFRQTFKDSSVPILVTPQQYPSEGGGVSYNGYHANLSTCLDSWKYQMMDMVGLGEFADVLIAGQYSSFTQSLPLSRLLNDNQRRRFFCDVDKTAKALKCYSSIDGIYNWFSNKNPKYVGAIDKVDKSSFAGPQIFLPADMDLHSLKDVIARGGQKKKK